MPVKSCPQCGRTYSDESFSFCLLDGSLLSPPDSDRTLVLNNRWFDSTLEDADAVTIGKVKAPLPKPLKELQLSYWIALNKLLRSTNSVVTLSRPRPFFNLNGPLGHNRVKLFASIYLESRGLVAGVRILNRSDIYAALLRERNEIETELHATSSAHDYRLPINWRPQKPNQNISEISLSWHTEALADPDLWERCLQWHKLKLEALHRAFYVRVRTVEGFQTKRRTPSTLQANPLRRIVDKFWKGFQIEIRDDKVIKLNSPSIPSNPSGKSAMSKTISGFKVSAQIHPSANTADVNITVAASQIFYFAKLHKRRNYIQTELPDGVEWKLNKEGESWIILRRDFSLSKEERWKAIYSWFKLNLRRFFKVFFPRIAALKRKYPSPS